VFDKLPKDIHGYDSKYRSHYAYLDAHLKEFLAKVDIDMDICCPGIIHCHGDKGYSYRDQWNKGELHFFHGMAIYLLTYLRPFSDEVRETKDGWVDPSRWVLENKDRFLPHLPPVE